MSSLKTIRELAETTLKDAGLNAYAYVPGRIAPPCAVIQAGDPYIEQAETFIEHVIRLEIVIVLRAGDNRRTATDLDEYLETHIDALDEAGFLVQNVTQPTPITWNSTDYPGVIVTVTHDFTLNN
ncbi:hypothetical protein [Agrococcus casei]|uniref:Uncharacterized protein n=1 Tax=Agrococcus casei LMG 22410 TaxID=1255656 RepID=A0A1R4GFJ2_9MICO|nr:hypothetical protein [Agrococcus casei]SJM66835.1 hypothetical protein CZ674_11505 [Agrococcus casei LMG 22410]